uniref:hypothetical protein n=1 Tax=Escherichia coli TaxID=562 RepID=UPI001BCEFE05|nr:hypothetical protein [Escherichia coli]QUN01897.1 hypothetical protein [Escherichia coli]
MFTENKIRAIELFVGINGKPLASQLLFTVMRQASLFKTGLPYNNLYIQTDPL